MDSKFCNKCSIEKNNSNFCKNVQSVKIVIVIET